MRFFLEWDSLKKAIFRGRVKIIPQKLFSRRVNSYEMKLCWRNKFHELFNFKKLHHLLRLERTKSRHLIGGKYWEGHWSQKGLINSESILHSKKGIFIFCKNVCYRQMRCSKTLAKLKSCTSKTKVRKRCFYYYSREFTYEEILLNLST